MSTFKKALIVLLLLLASVASVIHNVAGAPDGIDDLVDIAATSDGMTLIEQVQDEKIKLSLVDEKGVRRKKITLPQRYRQPHVVDGEKGERSVIVPRDIAMDDQGYVYMLREYRGELSGEYQKQDLLVCDMDRLWPRTVKVFDLDEPGVRYRWLNISSVAVLMGTNETKDTLYRTAYDLDSLHSRSPALIKGQRTYPIDPKHGIYEAVPVGANAAYITQSGYVFRAKEGEMATVVNPIHNSNDVLIPLYILPTSDSQQVLVGQLKTGDINLLDIETGKMQNKAVGSKVFAGVEAYTLENVLRMSAAADGSYASVVRSPVSGQFELVVGHGGANHLITKISAGMGRTVWTVLWDAAVYFAVLGILTLVLALIVYQVHNSRTILVKLGYAVIPLILAIFLCFAAVAYNYYRDAVMESFYKQVNNELDLMVGLITPDLIGAADKTTANPETGTAETTVTDHGLFGIEHPQHFAEEAYTYIAAQMKVQRRSHKVFCRIGCLEEKGMLSIVDEDLPCAYPLTLIMDNQILDMYEKAALTSEPRFAVVNDAYGERISCVMPIGGSAGNLVYLMEVGIYSANVDTYIVQYLLNYAGMMILFILAAAIILHMVFTRILSPLTQMQLVLEQFAQGQRHARMQVTTRDELSDIARVFNKMANDIEVQMYNLKSLSETYYRFVPQRIFRLMGRENLGELNLDTHMQGRYNVLCCELSVHPERMEHGVEQEMINQFFNILNEFSDKFGATLVVDNVNLCSLKIICPETGSRGIDLALKVLSQIDAYNAKADLHHHLDVMFLLHRADVYCGICGDKNRYVPALISLELEALTRRMQQLHQYTSRMLVTQTAYETLDHDKYESRFIGTVEDSAFDSLGLYDFYEENTPEIIRRINNTRGPFDKAIALYQQKRYYDAKNLFAIVLRENQYDNVARYYIFQCEQKL